CSAAHVYNVCGTVNQTGQQPRPEPGRHPLTTNATRARATEIRAASSTRRGEPSKAARRRLPQRKRQEKSLRRFVQKEKIKRIDCLICERFLVGLCLASLLLSTTPHAHGIVGRS